MDDRLLTEPEAARILGLKRSSLQKLRLDPQADSPPHVKFRRSVRYRRADLDAWIARHVRG